MGCSANSESHRALRGHIHALLRLEFDQELPVFAPSAPPCCVDCGQRKTQEPGYCWTGEDARMRPICQLSEAQLRQALGEARSLLRQANLGVQRRRYLLGKQALVHKNTRVRPNDAKVPAYPY